MTAEQIQAVRAVAGALLEAIEGMGDKGAPEGHLYATLAGKLSLSQFQSIIRGMLRAGWITREGFVLHYAKGLPATQAAPASWQKARAV